MDDCRRSGDLTSEVYKSLGQSTSPDTCQFAMVLHIPSFDLHLIISRKDSATISSLSDVAFSSACMSDSMLNFEQTGS